MFNEIYLRLTGMAYVSEVIHVHHRCYVTLNVIIRGDSDQSKDKIWLNCMVEDGSLIALLTDIKMQKDPSIIIQFDAALMKVLVAKTEMEKVGLFEKEDNLFIHIRCLLKNISDYFIEGESQLMNFAAQHKIV